MVKPIKRPRDVNEIAFRTLQIATGEIPNDGPPMQPAKNPHAQALAALGASKGGKARAAKLSPAKRKAIATKAAKARWSEREK